MDRFSSFLAVLCLVVTAAVEAREWTDASGHYRFEADMIGFNDQVVVLKKQNQDLLSMSIKDLSVADREYLKSEQAVHAARQSSEAFQTWTLKSGLKIIGKVLDYAHRNIAIQRIRGKTYVNDQQFEKLDGVYRAMLPDIVAHFEGIKVDGREGFEQWAVRQMGQRRTFPCDGLLLELENGDLYGIPFFFFSTEDLEVVKPGWERWKDAEEEHEREHQRFLLESQAQAYQTDEQEQQRAMRQMIQVQLQLQAYEAGIYDLWEVMLVPGTARTLMPLQVIVPGRNSDQAAAIAMQNFPGYRIGPIAKVRRRY